MRVLDMFRQPLVAIDVGTATTRVAFGSAAFLELPSVVREEAGGTEITRPVMRGGVVADIAGVASVLGMLLGNGSRVLRRMPAAVVCAPTDVSPIERDALVEAVAAGGASVVRVVPEPLAAAIGARVDVASEYATALVDIGEGVTDLAVFRNGTIVASDATRIGCGTFRAAIRDWIELQQGPIAVTDEAIDAEVRAWCGPSSRPSSLLIRHADLTMLLEPVIEAIASFVATTIERLPGDLAVEVIESGVHVTGGGAHLHRLIAAIEQRTAIEVHRAEHPRTAVIRGASAMLHHRQRLR